MNPSLISDGALPPPVEPSATPVVPPGRVWRATRAHVARLLSTPAGAALFTAWSFAVVIGIACLLPTHTTVETMWGTGRARCGLDVFVFGYPDPGVSGACRSAEATRFALFIPAVLMTVGGGAVAAVMAIRASRWWGNLHFRATSWIRARPVRSAIVAAGALAVAPLTWSLRPVSSTITWSGQLAAVNCGPDGYFAGAGDPRLSSACGALYGTHAHVLIGSGIVVSAGLATVVQVWLARLAAPSRRLAGMAVVGALSGAAALVALTPVAVLARTEAGQPVLARCGLDTYLAGYPDDAVQSVCRSHFGGHAAAGILLGLIGVTCMGLATAWRIRGPSISGAPSPQTREPTRTPLPV